MKGERGFTLVEVLIALGVFALLSAASVGIIRLATNAQESVEAVADDLAAIERARSVIRLDMLQVTDRSFRPAGSQSPVGPVLGGQHASAVIDEEEPEEEILMAFVRTGWSNPGYKEPRASVQQVTYLARDGQLLRRIRPFPDQVEDTPFRDQVLLDQVQDIRMEFYGPRGWQPDWGGQGETAAPGAIRLVLSHPDFGEFNQDFLVGGGQ